MNNRRLDQPHRNKVALTSRIVPVAICAFAITLTAVAQVAQPVPASSVAAVQDKAPKLQFKAPTISALKAGVPSAFNLCSGQAVSIPAGNFTDADGMKMDAGTCGDLSSSAPNVSGGNPPYHFQWASGSFPPLGMHLGMNGLLYGTPAKPPLGGYAPFSVCATDLSGNEDCQKVTVGTQPAQAAQAHSHAPLILGALALGGVAAVVGAKEMSKSSTGSGVSAGQCDGFSSTVNACGPCSCDPNAGSGSTSCPDNPQCGGGQCFNYSSDGNQKAPFCN